MAQLSQEKLEIFEKLPVPKAVLKLVGPAVLSQLITLIYNMADTFFVGRTGDSYQVAAVSMAFTAYFLLMAVGNLFGIGGGSLIARLLGAKKIEKVKHASAFALYGGIVGGAVLSALVAVFLHPLLIALGSSENTYQFGKDYILWVIVYGGVPTVAGMILGHLLRSEGYSRQAGIGVAFGGILNMVLDPLFIFTLGLGVKGAAMATAFSHTAAIVYYLLVYRSLRGKTVVSLRLRDFRFDKEIVGQVFKIGLPACISTILTCLSNTIAFHAVSRYGDINTAAYGVTKKLDMIPMTLCMGASSGALPLIAYNYSSGDHKRMKAALLCTMEVVLTFTVLYVLAGRFFGGNLVQVFIDQPDTVAAGRIFVGIECLATPFMALNSLMNTTFQAMGKGLLSLIFSACENAIVRIPILLTLNRLLAINGILWAQFTTEILMLCFCVTMFRRVMRSVKQETGC